MVATEERKIAARKANAKKPEAANSKKAPAPAEK
jgi:hypothetical protein